jgi:hypothetical protein
MTLSLIEHCAAQTCRVGWDRARHITPALYFKDWSVLIKAIPGTKPSVQRDGDHNDSRRMYHRQVVLSLPLPVIR